IGSVQAQFVNRAGHELIAEPGEGNVQAIDRGLGLGGLNVAGLRRDRPLEIVELDIGALFGERLHDSNPVLRVSDLLSDVKRFNFHGGDLITNQLRAARPRWRASSKLKVQSSRKAPNCKPPKALGKAAIQSQAPLLDLAAP